LKLIFHDASHGQPRASIELALTGATEAVGGFREASCYHISAAWDVPLVAYVDDKRLPVLPGGSAWVWETGFCIGSARLELLDPEGKVVSVVVLDVTSDEGKLCEEDLRRLIDALLAWAPQRLAGDGQTFLSLDAKGQFSAQLLYARMKQYGPAFCSALDACRRHPHSSFETSTQRLPVDRVRRLPRKMSDPRVLAYCAATAAGHHMPAPLVVSGRLAATLDTLANRSLYALAASVLRAAERLIAHHDAPKPGADPSESTRHLRRNQVLRGITAALKSSLAWFSQAGVMPGQGVAEGLTQMLRIPSYARAVQLGKLACSESFAEKADKDADLPLNSSWGLYEEWCFEQTRQLIEEATGIEPARLTRAFGCEAIAYRFARDGLDVTLAAQVTFTSGARLTDRRICASLSRERRPDLVLFVEKPGSSRWYILDAKYRQHKANVLDAMSSAHIYRDSLYLRGQRCQQVLLLTPGKAFDDEWSIFAPHHWNEFGTGVLSDFRPQGPGLSLAGGWLAGLLELPSGPC
jgi:hypothetical protein